MTHVEHLPAHAGSAQEWPLWVPHELRSAYAERGIEHPWLHQVAAGEHAWEGRSVVIATGTATGKSLGYQLPVLSRLLQDPRAKALYVSPTKALGHDQLRAVRELGVEPGGSAGVRPAAYDGDTAPDDRDWAREHSRWIFTNPDMLSRGILPQHARWHMLFRRLRYVVIDECHIYRGLFGSHVAHVIRRLRRICAKYGAEPTFVLASATARNPAESASALTGVQCAAVTDSDAPRGARTFALWEPPLTDLVGEQGAPVRRTATAEAARLLADLVIAGRRTLVFVRSRRAAEVVTLTARGHLQDAGAGELADRIAAYRAGYLPSERRALERALSTGELMGAAATTALELGIDVAGLDAVIVAGFPGTLASVWQQVGRAGRRRNDALAVFVARDDPLDTYLAHHPEALFERAVEATVINPHNPYVLRPQLACAAYELPITVAETDALFGGEVARDVLGELTADRVLRRRPGGWYYSALGRPGVDLRGAGATVALIESDTGAMIGTVDSGAADGTVHPGAVYLHRGETWVVDELDLAEKVALLHTENPPYSTFAQESSDIRVLQVHRSVTAGEIECHLADVEVTSQVLSFQRRRTATNEVIDQTALDLPARQLRTTAVLWTLSSRLVDSLGPVDEVAALLPGALHAAEHASIGMLPLIATCDRWDIGGVSTAMHPDTLRPSVFVYDGHPGGAGFAEQGFERIREWLEATLEAIIACECADGCPSCVQSPKCGNGNEPLHKGGAIALLRRVTAALAQDAGSCAADGAAR
ncbi:DEAD/DEAH box helicase [Cumulibacter manganitolerans]|uniref:DEAD/DEAH box helicase n=1 Tax=Cumulibacter manganitolerans TaxID=1884992 RepID=UPI001886400B|nr:DEAD/DEAH box helicase [Cumulibacter manganitolerans]